jgi:hypothetical protein
VVNNRSLSVSQKRKVSCIKNILVVFLVCGASAASAQKPFNYNEDFKTILARAKDSSDSLFYDKQIKRFTSNDSALSTAEILALMIGFTDKSTYKPFLDLDTEREIYRLNNIKKYDEALDLENRFLKDHPLSVKAIYEKSYTFFKLGQQDSAGYYLFQQQRIFAAMYYSGVGSTEAKAIFALGPADGQDFITKFVGAKIKSMNSDIGQDGNYYDAIEAQLDDGLVVTFYFIIQHTMEKPMDK